ncbi:MAG: hypothetical protein LBJ58_00875, partial [Tannerellaceae bacterium]|nr:hypothetical protein [Tannerellaceae bacterium]
MLTDLGVLPPGGARPNYYYGTGEGVMFIDDGRTGCLSRCLLRFLGKTQNIAVIILKVKLFHAV